MAKFYDDDSLICSYATSPTEADFCAERGLFSPASAKGEIEGEMQKFDCRKRELNDNAE